MVVLLRFPLRSVLKNKWPGENRRTKTSGHFESTELTDEQSDRDDIILIT